MCLRSNYEVKIEFLDYIFRITSLSTNKFDAPDLVFRLSTSIRILIETI